MADEDTIVSDTTSIFEKIVSGLVVLGGLLITILLIWVLWRQLVDISADIPTAVNGCWSVESAISEAGEFEPEHPCLIALETEAQSLRTHRAQSIVAARLFIQAISILAGISLMTMGSSFIFARIKGPNSSLSAEVTLAGSDANGWKVIASSYFPGVILTVLGSIIVVATVSISTFQKSITNDRPVFLDYPKGSYIEYYPVALGPEALSEDEKKDYDDALAILQKEGIIE